MNINLAKKKTRKNSGLKLGLNSRKNAFGGDDDDSSSSSSSTEKEEVLSGRQAVNRAIAKEQAALRERAMAAVAAADQTVYDYDGAYDSFHAPSSNAATTSTNDSDSKQSRYIGDLLAAAETRKQERDIAYERKVAREQAAEEEAEPEYRGKEKFVTAAYKRKLEERKVWMQNDKKQEAKEQQDDVTKKVSGVGMANFYGNLNKNVAMGGQSSKAITAVPKEKGQTDSTSTELGFLAGFAKDESATEETRTSRDSSAPTTNTAAAHPRAQDNTVLSKADQEENVRTERIQKHQLRDKKVAEARERYLQRKQSRTIGQ